MTEDHERIEELLAGYALRALEGEDAAEADRLLAEHVPSCLACRRALDGFRALTGDLALAATPASPPDLLLPRIHRALDASGGPRARGLGYLAAAASIVALVAMGGVSLSMAGRLSEAESKARLAVEAVSSITESDDAVAFAPLGTASDSTFVEVVDPEFETIYLATDRCPLPRPGMAYQLWLGDAGEYVPYGQFVPEDGHVILAIQVDVARFDEILITEELEGSNPESPNIDGGRSWHASLT